jgi:hypothetical protein
MNKFPDLAVEPGYKTLPVESAYLLVGAGVFRGEVRK